MEYTFHKSQGKTWEQLLGVKPMAQLTHLDQMIVLKKMTHETRCFDLYINTLNSARNLFLYKQGMDWRTFVTQKTKELENGTRI